MSAGPYASDPARSRGRVFAERPSHWRTDFQRDRDRIIHATSFRRLKGKTQVFLAGEGDHYRTRLTHTLEVAQIARSLASALGLDEDLTEAIALAHDLGHPPFGHSGERALNQAMAAHGGFDHNIQSLRVVTKLERRYPLFDGLNPTWELLEGLVKHGGPVRDKPGGGTGMGTTQPTVAEIDAWQSLDLSDHPSAEAQVASISDDIAYDAHDIDDGLRAGLLDLSRLAELETLARQLGDIQRSYPDLASDRIGAELVRRFINGLVEDVLTESGQRLKSLAPISADDIRQAGRPMIAFSTVVAHDERAVKSFLHAELYLRPEVTEVMTRAEELVVRLYDRYWTDSVALPESWRVRANSASEDTRARRLCDFIAGMTDRFAVAEYQRLFDRVPDFG